MREILPKTFYECRNLRRVELSEGLEKIGVAAFVDSGVEAVVLPSSTRVVGGTAFAQCRNLRSVTLNEGLRALGPEERLLVETHRGDVFLGSALEHIVLPSTLQVIEEGTFFQCANLRSIRLPDRLEEIGFLAFGGTGLEEVAFPRSVRKVGQSAFCKCRRLRRAVLNEGLQTLGADEYQNFFERSYGVFQESALENVELPSTLRRIGYSAFEGCAGLKSVALPDGLEHIGKRCFQKSALESVRLPPALRVVDENTFRECRRLRSVELPEGLERICIAAFYECGLESVSFPASLREICQTSFCLCPNLRSAKFGEGLEALGTRTYQDSSRIYHGVFSESALEHVELPSTLRRIEYNAFNGCRNLREVRLPERLEYIGKLGFQNSGLEEFVAPPGLKEIDGGAFSGCAGLRHATLNKGLEALRDYYNGECCFGAFQCTGIREITLPATLRQVGQYAFSGCSGLVTAYVECGCRADLSPLQSQCCTKIVRLRE